MAASIDWMNVSSGPWTVGAAAINASASELAIAAARTGSVSSTLIESSGTSGAAETSIIPLSSPGERAPLMSLDTFSRRGRVLAIAVYVVARLCDTWSWDWLGFALDSDSPTISEAWAA